MFTMTFSCDDDDDEANHLLAKTAKVGELISRNVQPKIVT